MTRLFLAFSFTALVALAGACGSSAIGPCSGAETAEGCGQTCASDDACPSGLHCASGACAAECTAGGSGCASGETCDDRGRCVPSDDRPDAPPRPDANCPDVIVKAEGQTPTVHLLLDRSGSMKDDFGTTSTGGVCDPKNATDCPSRYKAMTDALVGPGGVVTSLESKVIFGASLYDGKSTECPRLPSKPRVLGNHAEIKKLLDGARPDGATPTGDSIDALLADFVKNPPAPNSPPVILLATDGEPDTCEQPDPNEGQLEATTAAQKAFAAGIRLFVLAVGDDVGAPHLQEMANAGAGKDLKTGTETFYRANNPAELSAALQTIIGGVRSCSFDVDGKVSGNASRGEVKLDSAVLVFGTDWKLVDENTIELLGNACETFLARGGEVQASFPCGGIVLD